LKRAITTSFIGPENEPILDQTEVHEIISERDIELLQEDPDSKY
jgi:hypothetical protein